MSDQVFTTPRLLSMQRSIAAKRLTRNSSPGAGALRLYSESIPGITTGTKDVCYDPGGIRGLLVGVGISPSRILRPPFTFV